MKLKHLLLFALLSLMYFSASAQSYTIKGSVKDTVAYTTTLYTSVSVLNVKDSVLKAFTRADEEGNFLLSVDSPGTYIIIVAHPLFANYIDQIATSGNTTDIGTIGLVSKLQLIQEVVVSDRRAITIKGDTTEYAADSFKVREFDNVDALLKRLPGIEIDKDGNIKAHGQKVQKMMVDGDEFFADDPAMVAKMLRASAVDKVQVFDKKSEQAEFTGIDDGEKIKTINLQLKDNAKKGYFGKIAAGGGTDGFWENQAMINSFKKKRKIAAYGIMSNTNTTGLDWDDSNKYGGDANSTIEMRDDGSMVSYREGSGSDWNDQGLPKTWTAGVHYGNKWLEKDALKFNGDYTFIKNTTEAYNNMRTQYTLPDTQYVNTSVSNSFESNEAHKIGMSSEYKIDSLTDMRVRVSGRTGQAISKSISDVGSTNLAGDAINSSHQQNDNVSQNKSIDASLTLRRKFTKVGRSFSASINTKWTDRESDGHLFTANNFYALGRTDTVDQRKEGKNNSLTFGSKLSYTEPLAKKIFLEVNYSVDVNNNQTATYSYDQIPELGRDTLNQLFSSDYIFNVLTNSIGSNLRFNYEKVNFSFGGNLANASFRQTNNFDNSTLRYNYINFFPRANIRYIRTKQSSVSLGYNGRTRQPTINELQPIRQNNDPLNVMIGNPDLKQEFTHDFNFNANDYKVLTSRWLNMSANYSFTQNAISQTQNVDEAGRRTYQSINVDGNMRGGLWLHYGFKINPLKLNVNLGGSANYNRNNSMINGLKNISNNLAYGPSVGMYFYSDTLLNLSYSINPNYNRNTTSIRPDVVTDYWSLNQSFNGSINLPLRFELGTEIEWFIRQKMDAQDQNNNVFRMNAYVSRAFFKDRSLVAKAAGYDIFNQNIGFSRSVNDNYFMESRYNNIRRYFMFSLTWNFTKSGAMAPAPAMDFSAE